MIQFDLCIIGGGITGAGIALDATLRGLKTVVIDKADFGAGTSTISSKLIHGGFRYLKEYQFGLVREALIERYYLLHLAPHLVTRLPSIFPIFSPQLLIGKKWAFPTTCGIIAVGYSKI